MPNIAAVLKGEIARLARKELRTQTDSLKRAVSAYRSEIASLKQRVSQLERGAKRKSKEMGNAAQSADEGDEGLRFRASGFARHRQRLGLSAAECGQILGVSALTVYKWEKGEARPRRSYMPAIAAMRKMGKRQALARLAELA